MNNQNNNNNNKPIIISSIIVFLIIALISQGVNKNIISYISKNNYKVIAKDYKLIDNNITICDILVELKNNNSTSLYTKVTIDFYDNNKHKTDTISNGTFINKKDTTHVLISNNKEYKTYKVKTSSIKYKTKDFNKYNKEIKITNDKNTSSNILFEYKNNSNKELNISFYALFYDDKDNIIAYNETYQANVLEKSKNNAKITIPTTKDNKPIDYKRYQLFIKDSIIPNNSNFKRKSNIKEDFTESQDNALLVKVKNNNNYPIDIDYTIELYNEKDELIDIIDYNIISTIKPKNTSYSKFLLNNNDYKSYKLKRKVYKKDNIDFYNKKINILELNKNEHDILSLKYKNNSNTTINYLEIAVIFYDDDNNIVDIETITDNDIKNNTIITKEIFTNSSYSKYETNINYAYNNKNN